MSFVTDIADEIRKLPELAKGAVAFAGSLASVEAILVTVSQATHIIPPSWLQFVAAGVAVVTGGAVVLTDLASSAPVVQKAIDVVEEVGKIATDIKSALAVAAPAPVAARHLRAGPASVVPSPASNATSNAVAHAVSNAVQPVVQDISTVVTDVASSAASKVVDRVITDFSK